MDSISPQAARAMVLGLLTLEAMVLLPSVAVALLLVLRARATVGAVVSAERPRRRTRLVLLVAPQLAALALVLWLGLVPIAFAASLLVLGILLAVMSPGADDAVCGESGVQRGWTPRRWAELEEWRLVGDHLRFRLFGEWTSVPVPASEQERVRTALVAACPGRESPYG